MIGDLPYEPALHQKALPRRFGQRHVVGLRDGQVPERHPLIGDLPWHGHVVGVFRHPESSSRHLADHDGQLVAEGVEPQLRQEHLLVGDEEGVVVGDGVPDGMAERHEPVGAPDAEGPVAVARQGVLADVAEGSAPRTGRQRTGTHVVATREEVALAVGDLVTSEREHPVSKIITVRGLYLEFSFASILAEHAGYA